MKVAFGLLFSVCALAAGVVPAQAKRASVSVPMSAVRAYSGERGAFYIVAVAVPEHIIGRRLDTALIEFAVATTALSLQDSLVTPIVGVFPLSGEFTEIRRGDLFSVPEFDSAVPSARPVALGENRVLRMDITEIVKAWISNPSSNHGIVIGTITGPNVGAISLKEGEVPSRDPLYVTFYYQARSGDRIPPN